MNNLYNKRPYVQKERQHTCKYQIMDTIITQINKKFEIKEVCKVRNDKCILGLTRMETKGFETS